jgi:hypothetical protein
VNNGHIFQKEVSFQFRAIPGTTNLIRKFWFRLWFTFFIEDAEFAQRFEKKLSPFGLPVLSCFRKVAMDSVSIALGRKDFQPSLIFLTAPGYQPKPRFGLICVPLRCSMGIYQGHLIDRFDQGSFLCH